MEEKKSRKINIGMLACIVIIVILIIALGVIYYFGIVINNEKIADLKNSHKEEIEKLEKDKSILQQQINTSNEENNTDDTSKEDISSDNENNININVNDMKSDKDYVVLYKGDKIDKKYGRCSSGMFEEQEEISNTITYYNYENGKYVGETEGYFSNDEGIVAKISISEKYNAIPRKYENIDTIPQELSFLDNRDDIINIEINKIDLDGNGKEEYICSYTKKYETNEDSDRYEYDLLISHIELFDNNFNKIANLVYLESDSDVYLSLKESIEYIDIDKDGIMEILIEIPGWEWRTIEVFKYDGNQLSGNVGEYNYASWRHGA